MDRQVRTWKESEQARGTHFLESTDGQTSQDTEGIQENKGHSQTGEDKSEHKSEQARATHQLESADGQTSQEIRILIQGI